VSRIWLSPPDVTAADRELLLAALDGGWIAPVGPDLDAFEEEAARACGRRCAVGVSSGTAALHLLLMEAGIGAGDEVLVSTFTFAASVFPIRYLGATPVLIDSDPSTWQISPALLADELEARARAGRPQPRALIAVDLYGQCADYDAIQPLLDEHGITLIGDAAEALGATYRGRPAGSFGVGAALSFNGNKIITTSGGGMVLTDDEALAARCRKLATQAREPVPHYEHTEIGYNYRLSNLLAALGRGQLADLDRRLERRRAINRRYRDELAEVDAIEFMPEAPYGRSNLWLTCITVDPDRATTAKGTTAEDLRLALEREDIESRPTWKPMHLQPLFCDAPARVDGTSERIFATGLCLPSGSSLTESDQARVIEVVRAGLG
jgi:dTDP-4-amino-4,6-dideoxygalactose transaminase